VRYFRHKGILIIPVLILAAAIVSTIAGIHAGNKIGIYKGDQEIRKYTEPSAEGETEQLFAYEMVFPFSINLSLLVPSTWAKSMEDDSCTFVHRETGSAIKIQRLPYDPSVNNVTEQSLAVSVVSEGKTFAGFRKLSNSSYELYYSDSGVTTYDYIEEVLWDRENIVKYTCICRDEYYEDMKQVFSDSFSSLTWDREDPVPPGLVLYYNPVYQYEYAVPVDWYVSESGNISYAQNPEGTASVMVKPVGYTGTLQDISAEDLASFLNPNGEKNNFLMRQYEASYDRGTVWSTHTANDALVQEKTLVYQKCGTLFLVTFSYIQGMVDELTVESCLSLFRSFLSEPVAQDETDPDPEESFQDDIENAAREINDYFDDSDH